MEVWVRIGAYVLLPKPLGGYQDEETLGEGIAEAIRRRDFRVDGDCYVPGSAMKDISEKLSFDRDDNDLELGDL